jgi:RNA polymerase primary sigma factor
MRQLKITKTITKRESKSLDYYFSEVSKIKLLTEEEEHNLLQGVANGDKAALNDIVKANLRFVVSVAKQFQNQGLSLEDLISDGNVGLIKAAERFDNSRGFKFISYAVWWIRQSIMQSISDNGKLIRLPNNQNLAINKLNKTIQKLEIKLEREPTEEELAQVLEESEIKVRDTMLSNTGRVASLDSPVSSDSDDVFLSDCIVNKETKSPDEFLIKESFSKDLEKILKSLQPRQRVIICMYYGILGYQTMTLEEIGDYLDLTRERVRQIKDMTIRVLKCNKNSKVLRQHI